MSILDPEPPVPLTRLAAVDFEATCLPGPGSFPIELGIARVSDAGPAKSWLIRPPESWLARSVLDPAAARLHGITREELVEHGLPVERVLDELQRVAPGLVLVSDAAGADGYWMTMLCATGRRPARQVEPLKEHIAPFGQACLAAAVAEGRRRYPPCHRAGPDARSLAEVLRILAGLA